MVISKKYKRPMEPNNQEKVGRKKSEICKRNAQIHGLDSQSLLSNYLTQNVFLDSQNPDIFYQISHFLDSQKPDNFLFSTAKSQTQPIPDTTKSHTRPKAGHGQKPDTIKSQTRPFSNYISNHIFS